MIEQKLSRDEFLAAVEARIKAAGLCNTGRNDSNTKKPRTEPCRQCGGVVPVESRYRYFCKDACEARYRMYPQDGSAGEQPKPVAERSCVDCGEKHRRPGKICSKCERGRAKKNKDSKLNPEIVTCECGCGRTFEKRRLTHKYFDPLVCKIKIKNENRRNRHNERSGDAASGHHGQEAQPQDLPGSGEPQGRGMDDQSLACASSSGG